MMNGLFSRSKSVETKKNQVDKSKSNKELPQKHKEQQKYYLKLTIPHGEKFIKKRFKLLYKGKLIWGTEIERAPNGHDLEYRNIIVTDNNPENYTLEPNIPSSIQISDKQFITPEQKKYDEKYRVQFSDGLWYSIRGNDKNPRKIILTFPGFGPSTTRIPYSVSFLSGFTDDDLKDALFIAFQDRYHVSGTYMLEDDFGKKLYPVFNEFIKKVMDKYSLKDSDLLFFGASKGGSIALRYMENYVNATLITAVPQVNLLYYWQSKPFFRNNLFHLFKKKGIPDNIGLLKRYLKEKRDIYYFYTDDDELSNYSIIELLKDKPGLKKFRVEGVHGSVTKKVLPTIESLMRKFIVEGRVEESSSKIAVIGQRVDDYLGIQITLPKEYISYAGDFNAYITAEYEGFQKNYLLSKQVIKRYVYTAETQRLLISIDDIESVNYCYVYLDDGSIIRYSLDSKQLGDFSKDKLLVNDLSSYHENLLKLDEQTQAEYVVVEKEFYEKYSYKYISSTNKSDRKLFVIISDQFPEEISTENNLLILKTKNHTNLNIFLSRVLKQKKLISLDVTVEKKEGLLEILLQLFSLDLPNVVITLINPLFTREEKELIVNRTILDRIDNWHEEGKLVVKYQNDMVPEPFFRTMIQ